MDTFVIDHLRERLPGQVTTAADPDYDDVRATFNATVQRRPAVIVRARSDRDVLAAVVAAAWIHRLAVVGGTYGDTGVGGLANYWKGHLLRALDEPVIEGIVESLADHPDGRGGILLESIRGAAHVEPDGGAAFGQRAATWNASALAIWQDPAADDAQIAWARSTSNRLAVGSLSGAGYANYAPVDETIERVRLAFGTERFAGLAMVKARYDPANRFRFNLNIAPG